MNYEERNRGSGRTTIIILNYTKTAMQEAGTWINIFDHYFKEEAHERVTDKVCEILTSLNVEFERRKTAIKVVPLKRIA